MRNLMLWASIAMISACGSKETDTSSTGDADTDSDSDSDADTDADDSWDSTGDPTRDADETLQGDLSTGAIVSLDWADDSGVYCWTGNENSNFSGNHVFFVIDKHGEDNVAVSVDPVAGVDISLYFLEYPDEASIEYPPDVTSPMRCESSFDQAGDGNPGGKELFLMQGPGTGSRILLVGVAGANGATTGAFTMKIWRGNTEGYDGPK